MLKTDRKTHVDQSRRTTKLEPPVITTTSSTASTPASSNTTSSSSSAAPITVPSDSSVPVGTGAIEGGGKKGAQIFMSRGATEVSVKQSPPPSTSVPTQSRAFMTKVVIELTKARDRLQSELGITDVEWARVSKPEHIASFDFSYLKDDGSTADSHGWRVIFSTILGAGKGGLRVVPDLDEDTVKALASEMPAKTAIMNAHVGGAKGGFVADSKKLSDGEFARAMRSYVEALMDAGAQETPPRIPLGPHIDVPAPDVGTSHPRVALMDIAVDAYLGWLAKNGIDKVGNLVVPKELASIKPDAKGLSTPFADKYMQLRPNGNVGLLATFTGKSVAKGGSLGRNDATGLGVALSTLEVLKHQETLPKNASSFTGQSVAVQGYGNVGRGAVLSFAELGAKVTTITEFDGSPYVLTKAGGFTKDDVAALDAFKTKHGTLRGFPGTETSSDMNTFWSARVDILAPCAKEGVITDDVANLINAKVIAEGANGPTTHEGDAVLEKRGITVIPDVFCNAAGVTVSTYEMEQNLKGESWSLAQVNERLAKDIPIAFARLAEAQGKRGGTLRSAGFDVALTDFVMGLRASAIS